MGLLETIGGAIKKATAPGVQNPNKIDPALEQQLLSRGVVDTQGKAVVSAEAVKQAAETAPQLKAGQSAIKTKLNKQEEEKNQATQKAFLETQKKGATGIPVVSTTKPKIDPALKDQLEQRGMTEKLQELEKPVPTLFARVFKELVPASRGELRTQYMAQGMKFEEANEKATNDIVAMGAMPFDDNTNFGVEIGSMKEVSNAASRAIRKLFQKGGTSAGAFDKATRLVDEEMKSLGQQGLERLNKIFKEDTPSFKQKAQGLVDKVKEIPTQIRTKLISKYTPIGEFEKDIIEASGVKRSTKELPLQSKFELFSGSAGKAERDIKIFEKEVVEPVKNNLEDFNNFLALKRIESRLGTGLDRTKVADWTPEMVQETERALAEKVGQETMNKFKVQAIKYNDILDESLKGLVDSGRISKEGYDAIKANNDFYAKFKVLKYVNDAEKDLIKGTGKNISLGKEDVIKAMTGIEDKDFKLGNLLNTAEEVIYQNKIIGEKNRVMQEFAKVAEQGEDSGFAKVLKSGEDLRSVGLDPNIWDKVTVYENGVMKEIAVNKKVAESIKGMTPTQMGIFSKIMSYAAIPFRAGVTTANAAFQVVNMLFADIPRNLLLFKYGNNAGRLIQFPLDVLQSYYSALRGNFGKMNNLYDDFLKSGAANSTIARDIRPEAFKSKIAPKRLRDIGGMVLDNIAQFSNAVEEGGKILGLKRGLPDVKSGKITMEQLADEVRKYSGSPDFARSGTATRPLNLLYMFLNARIQGATLDLKRLTGFTGKQEAAQAWAKISAVVGIPALTLSIVNREKYQSDMDKLSEAEKNNYFIIWRDGFDVNDKGELYRKYWKIPKRETVKMVANMIEAGVNFAYDRNPEGAKTMGYNILNDLSPVNVSGNNLTERGESLVSGLNPLIKAPYEYVSNRDTFFHNDVVPQYLYGVESKNLTPAQQYYVNTPKFYTWLGGQVDESPIALQHLFKNFSGSLLTKNPITAVIDRFNGTGNLSLTAEEKAEAKKILEDVYAQGGEQIDVNRKAQEMYNEIGYLSIPEQKKRMAEYKKAGWLTKEVFDRYVKVYEKAQADFTPSDFTIKELGVENGRRAVTMYNIVKDLDPGSRKEKLSEWKAKKLLSENVMDQINWLAAHPKNAENITANMAKTKDITSSVLPDIR